MQEQAVDSVESGYQADESPQLRLDPDDYGSWILQHQTLCQELGSAQLFGLINPRSYGTRMGGYQQLEQDYHYLCVVGRLQPSFHTIMWAAIAYTIHSRGVVDICGGMATITWEDRA
jgi:hypothetical protein